MNNIEEKVILEISDLAKGLGVKLWETTKEAIVERFDEYLYQYKDSVKAWLDRIINAQFQIVRKQ